MTQDTVSIEARLDELARHNRMLTLVAAAAILAMLLAATGDPGLVRAGAFELVDEIGARSPIRSLASRPAIANGAP